jgi:hypothetical protein
LNSARFRGLGLEEWNCQGRQTHTNGLTLHEFAPIRPSVEHGVMSRKGVSFGFAEATGNLVSQSKDGIRLECLRLGLQLKTDLDHETTVLKRVAMGHLNVKVHLRGICSICRRRPRGDELVELIA